MARPATARRRVKVVGVVQGVGFRPFVLRLATELELLGFVGNDAAGVFVEVEGEPALLERFVERLSAEAPRLAVIEQVVVTELESPPGPVVGGAGFSIISSDATAGLSTLVPPDVGVCDECMAEVLDSDNRRYRHPFANCTDCGPRFSVIREMPYDRASTTMAGFSMCEACAVEYASPSDRRFHAQPIACPSCGPQLSFRRGEDVVEGSDAALAEAFVALAGGQVLAVKGLGGYHLACDAADDDAVGVLRRRKGRGDKPFALMVPDLEAAARLAELTEADASALRSSARPIVLCRRRSGAPVSAAVAPGSSLIGLMLPYSPLHHLLFVPAPGSGTPPPSVLVLTSGNLSDERICFEDDDARARLGAVADAFLVHDRPIAVPCDDSVVRVIDGEPLPIRRSRGFAPLPVRLPVTLRPTIGWGGELKTTFCLASEDHAWVSQHIGDLGSLETEVALLSQAEAFCAMYQVLPERHGVDCHPGYRTHRLSLEGAWPGRREVQHHHAHVASVMAENGLDGSSPVIGFAFDGTGYGRGAAGEPQIWGGEVLLADYADFERLGHLAALPLPGGDEAVRNPCRVAVAYLAALGLTMDGSSPAEAACGEVERGVVIRQVERGTGCTPTTSMGRLFDAVASLIGVCHRASYEAQAAIELEVAAQRGRASLPIRFDLGDDGVLDPSPVLGGLLAGLADGVSTEDLACSFHHAVARAVCASASRAAASKGRLPVALSGGVFQNVLLTGIARRALADAGFDVLTHRLVPPNDGGLALGQAVIAGYERI